MNNFIPSSLNSLKGTHRLQGIFWRSLRLRLRLPVGLACLSPLLSFGSVLAATPLKPEIPADSATLAPVPALTFAAYGDIPYLIKLPNGRMDDQVLHEEIAPAIRRRDDIPFVIHLGDLSRPETACFDAWLRHSKAFWRNEIVKPVFFTPGDNDWADCDRKPLAVRQSEIARLQSLRSILFDSPMTITPGWQLMEVKRILSRDPDIRKPDQAVAEIRGVLALKPRQFAKVWRYEKQRHLPENAIWWRDGVQFVSVHMTSTDNGRSEILLDDPRKATALVDRRDKYNQLWLNRAFALAQKPDTKALVIATQLDPFGPARNQETPLSRCLNNPAYAGFCRQVKALSETLAKPVLLLHGDTNAYCLDQPFETASNLWRLNAPGDFKHLDASLIEVFPDNSSKPFQAVGLLSGAPAPSVCDYSQ